MTSDFRWNGGPATPLLLHSVGIGLTNRISTSRIRRRSEQAERDGVDGLDPPGPTCDPMHVSAEIAGRFVSANDVSPYAQPSTKAAVPCSSGWQEARVGHSQL